MVKSRYRKSSKTTPWRQFSLNKKADFVDDVVEIDQARQLNNKLLKKAMYKYE